MKILILTMLKKGIYTLSLRTVLLWIVLITVSSCGSEVNSDNNVELEKSAKFLKGVDLSYVNQMEDCGVVYKDNGVIFDNYQLMKNHGANVVRVRLWHEPNWLKADGTVNEYSNFSDVVETIKRSKEQGMEVLLDFHYSDTWTDPSHQTIPVAWEHMAYDVTALTSQVYDYTYQTLNSLYAMNLMPEYVQVGNETNREILLPKFDTAGGEITGHPINWNRNAQLLNSGIAAVRNLARDVDVHPEIILHIADPHNADWWFNVAAENAVTDFDIIGLSYYPAWHGGSTASIGDIGNIISALKADFQKEVLIVETGVIWTTDWNDDATNMMNSEDYYLDFGYGNASPTAQANWLIDFTHEVKNSGGLGVVYWEPSWVSSSCATLWGIGSHWENVSFFDFNNELLTNGGIRFLGENYRSN